jgi:hypothetical protein
VQFDTRTIFSLSSRKEEQGRGEEPNIYKCYNHEPLAPTLAPFGGERELFQFGAGIKMRSGKSQRCHFYIFRARIFL